MVPPIKSLAPLMGFPFMANTLNMKAKIMTMITRAKTMMRITMRKVMAMNTRSTAKSVLSPAQTLKFYR